MGVYDTYDDIQLKVGAMVMAVYEIGDEVEIPDGVYVGLEGIVVIHEGIFIAVHSYVNTKWGDTLMPKEILYAGE